LESAAQTVPGGPSVACSTAAAIEWYHHHRPCSSCFFSQFSFSILQRDAAFKTMNDPSGRAAVGIHIESANGNPKKRLSSATESTIAEKEAKTQKQN
jgi:asparagine synthase (glutamine-hydrolysing)